MSIRFLADEDVKPMPGVFVLPQHTSVIGAIIEWLLLVWAASQAEEWRERIVFVPLGPR